MSENDEAEKQEVGIDGRSLGRSQMGKEERGGDEKGINLGYDPVPSGGRKDIDRWGIDCGNGRDGGKNDRLGGNVDG